MLKPSDPKSKQHITSLRSNNSSKSSLDRKPNLTHRTILLSDDDSKSQLKSNGDSFLSLEKGPNPTHNNANDYIGKLEVFSIIKSLVVHYDKKILALEKCHSEL